MNRISPKDFIASLAPPVDFSRPVKQKLDFERSFNNPRISAQAQRLYDPSMPPVPPKPPTAQEAKRGTGAVLGTSGPWGQPNPSGGEAP